MDSNKLIEILVEEYKETAQNNDWEDIRFLSDEELAIMNPLSDFDYVLMYEDARARLKEIDENLEFLEKKLLDPNIISEDRSETRRDIAGETIKRAIVVAEMKRLEKNYGREFSRFR